MSRNLARPSRQVRQVRLVRLVRAEASTAGASEKTGTNLAGDHK